VSNQLYTLERPNGTRIELHTNERALAPLLKMGWKIVSGVTAKAVA
jgi:hypothetical protein